MKKLEMTYEGKVKKIYATEKADEVIAYYKDDAAASNGEKKGQVEEKGVLSNSIASIILEMLNENGIKTHFMEELSERERPCEKVEVVPLEMTVRNVAAGSVAKRLGLEGGSEFRATVFELSYKDDLPGDPLINDYHAVGIGATTFEELNKIYEMTVKINGLLKEFFIKQNIRLIGFKLEFGRYNGGILLADEVSPDTYRFWDATAGKRLDKDRFRRGLGSVKDAYIEILNRIQK